MRKAERARFLSGGEQSEALRINGAWPHFLFENALFLTKWGLAPFIPELLLTRRGKSNVFWNHTAGAFLQWSLQLFPKTYASNITIIYCGFGDASVEESRYI